MCLCAISEICTSPCTPGAISTNAPKFVKRATWLLEFRRQMLLLPDVCFPEVISKIKESRASGMGGSSSGAGGSSRGTEDVPTTTVQTQPEGAALG